MPEYCRMKAPDGRVIVVTAKTQSMYEMKGFKYEGTADGPAPAMTEEELEERQAEHKRIQQFLRNASVPKITAEIDGYDGDKVAYAYRVLEVEQNAGNRQPVRDALLTLIETLRDEAAGL